MFLTSSLVIKTNAQKQSRGTSVRQGDCAKDMTISQQILKSSTAVVQILKPRFSNCLHPGLSRSRSAVRLTTNTKATL